MLKEEAEISKKVFEIKDTVYFRYKDKVFPCVKVSEGVYKIKTTLYWSMVRKKLSWINKVIEEKLEKQNNLVLK